MRNLILIGGPMGVGKSTVSRELLKILPSAVWLDGDWCWNADPFVVNKTTKAVVLDNICHCLKNFISCRQYKNVIFSWVLHEQDTIDGILDRLDLNGVKVVNASLVCSPQAMEDRLRADIKLGLRTEDVVERALERLSHYGGLNTVKIDTSCLSVKEIISQILKLL